MGRDVEFGHEAAPGDPAADEEPVADGEFSAQQMPAAEPLRRDGSAGVVQTYGHERIAPGTFADVLDRADDHRFALVGERADRLRYAPITIGARQIGEQFAGPFDPQLMQLAREFRTDAREHGQLFCVARRDNSAPTSSSDTPRSASSTSV